MELVIGLVVLFVLIFIFVPDKLIVCDAHDHNKAERVYLYILKRIGYTTIFQQTCDRCIRTMQQDMDRFLRELSQ